MALGTYFPPVVGTQRQQNQYQILKTTKLHLAADKVLFVVCLTDQSLHCSKHLFSPAEGRCPHGMSQLDLSHVHH